MPNSATALVSTHVRGRGEARTYRASTGGEFGEDGWVRSGEFKQLSCGVSVVVVSASASSFGSSSWGWVKSALGVGKTLSAV